MPSFKEIKDRILGREPEFKSDTTDWGYQPRKVSGSKYMKPHDSGTACIPETEEEWLKNTKPQDQYSRVEKPKPVSASDIADERPVVNIYVGKNAEVNVYESD